MINVGTHTKSWIKVSPKDGSSLAVVVIQKEMKAKFKLIKIFTLLSFTLKG